MVTRASCISWGGSRTGQIEISSPVDAGDIDAPDRPFLVVGARRSYGTSCLPAGDLALNTVRMNKVISFDPQNGILRAETGITFHEILDLCIPCGWFLPVTPGTGYVTLGGAIANDVHGKNHHNAGTLGRHVTQFEILRSDGSRRLCSPIENAELFAATIGGMGLTGIMLWAEIRLMRTASPHVDQFAVRFANIEQYFRIDFGEERNFTYSVAWIDGMARGRSLGRGLVLYGNHSRNETPMAPRPRTFRLPLAPPVNLVRPIGIKAMNALYFRRSIAPRTVEWFPYFYPLDAITNWNALYGPRGFHQFQCVVPVEASYDVIPRLLECVLARADGSALAVLKRFGSLPSPGILSFPIPGYTLALDIAHQGEDTLRMLSQLDEIVLRAGGRVNPYKDRRLSREVFRASFPDWRRLEHWIDPLCESQLSRSIDLTRPAIRLAKPVSSVATAR